MKSIAYAFYAIGIALILYAGYCTIAFNRLSGDDFMPAIAMFLCAMASHQLLAKEA